MNASLDKNGLWSVKYAMVRFKVSKNVCIKNSEET